MIARFAPKQGLCKKNKTSIYFCQVLGGASKEISSYLPIVHGYSVIPRVLGCLEPGYLLLQAQWDGLRRIYDYGFLPPS